MLILLPVREGFIHANIIIVGAFSIIIQIFFIYYSSLVYSIYKLTKKDKYVYYIKKYINIIYSKKILYYRKIQIQF
jgi:hypothetical protein